MFLVSYMTQRKIKMKSIKRFNITIEKKRKSYRMPNYFYHKFMLIPKKDENESESNMLQRFIDEWVKKRNEALDRYEEKNPDKDRPNLLYEHENFNETINEIVFDKILDFQRQQVMDFSK